MCYMVTWFKAPTKSNELNVLQTAVFGEELEARTFASERVLQGATDVMVWVRLAVPKAVTTVAWEDGR